MPRMIRKASVVLSAAELSVALGIPFENVTAVEWWTDPTNPSGPRGLRIAVETYEDIPVPSTAKALPNPERTAPRARGGR